MRRDQIFEFFRRLAEANPSPTTELESGNAYQLLVAVVLSAQATDAGVNIATKPLFERIKTPRQMVELGEQRLREAIKSIGLFNTKAKNVIALSQALIDNYNGEVPRTRDELQALPGVGRKTANVVLNTAFGEETFAVDLDPVAFLGTRRGFRSDRDQVHRHPAENRQRMLARECRAMRGEAA